MKYYLSALILGLLLSCQPTAVKVVETVPESREIPGSYSAWIIKENVNLRSKPDPGSASLAQLKDGEIIRVSGQQNQWLNIQTEEGISGWLRMDLAGPRNLSRTATAKVFADSVLPNFRANLFFDKTALYRIIYLQFTNPENYQSPAMKEMVNGIGTAYQERVYPGEVEIRLMQDGQEKPVHRKIFPAIGPAVMPSPLLPNGRLKDVSWQKDFSIRVEIIIPETLSMKEKLKVAETCAAGYPLPVQAIEIRLWGKESGLCLFCFKEDKNGTDYQEAECQ